MNLGGLGAAYGGFQKAENTQAVTEQNQAAAQEAAFKLLGAQVLGRALTGGQPQQGPQAPAPGQPSVPSAPAPQGNPPPMAQGGPPMAPPPQPAAGPPGAPVAQGGGGMPEISLQTLTQRILQTSPGVRNHPQVLMAALERAAPLLDRQSKEDLMELRKQMSTERLAQTGELAKARIDAARAAEEGKQGRFDAREARLAASTAVRQDQGYQRLEVQRQDLERKIQQGGDKQALSQWRTLLDAQHKRAQEIIQSNSTMSGLKKEDRAALLAEADAVYKAAIAAMRDRMGSTTPTGGTTPAGAPAAPKVQGQVPQNAPLVTAPAAGAPTVDAPPLAMLKPNTVTTFANGQKWTVGPDGQPKQVP